MLSLRTSVIYTFAYVAQMMNFMYRKAYVSAGKTGYLIKKKTGGWEGNRTPDTGIFSPLLYRLSYPASHHM